MASAMGRSATLSWVCLLRVGETASTRDGDLATPGFVQFCNSKTGEEGWTSRPLTRYGEGVRAWIHCHPMAGGLCADQLVWPTGAAGLDAGRV